MANAETTRTPDGGPYRRKEAIFTSAPQSSAFGAVFQTELASGVNGVEVSDVLEDTGEPDKRYLPGHPDADKDGYVAFPRINPAEEMVDLMGAQRGYEGNIAVMTAVKDMIMRSISLLS
jgi:flagellar basal-body rod protein FlgC